MNFPEGFGRAIFYNHFNNFVLGARVPLKAKQFEAVVNEFLPKNSAFIVLIMKILASLRAHFRAFR